jgi:hypothetical protein
VLLRLWGQLDALDALVVEPSDFKEALVRYTKSGKPIAPPGSYLKLTLEQIEPLKGKMTRKAASKHLGVSLKVFVTAIKHLGLNPWPPVAREYAPPTKG